ncbi:MAG: hypothetical protein VB094_03420 [Oscillibacter sp.]|nr:hypothetical protein [Oscillibacter sp.]
MNRAQIPGCLLALALLTGCGAPSSSAPAKSAEPQTVSPVYTDWSKLTPYEPDTAKALYSKFEPYQGDALTARDDYGPLLPYLGAEPSVSNYITDRLPLFGLVTADGQVVTEPVYASVYPISYYTQGRPAIAPFLILQKGDPAAGASNGRDSVAGEFSCTVAAPDGRWVRSFGIAGTQYADEAHMAVVQPDNSVTVLDKDGKTAAYFSGDTFAPYLNNFNPPCFGYEGGPGLSSKDGVLYVEGFDETQEDWRTFCYLNIADGTLSPDPPEGFSDQWPEGSGDDAGGYSPLVDAVTGTLYYYSRDYIGSAFNRSMLNILSADKRPLLSLPDESSTLYEPLIRNGLCSAVQGGAFCYYDLKSGKCVFRYPLRTNSD